MNYQKVLLAMQPGQDSDDGGFDQVLNSLYSRQIRYYLTTVIDEVEVFKSIHSEKVSAWDLFNAAQQAAQLQIDTTIAQMRARFPHDRFNGAVLSGVFFIELIKFAKREEIDLVCLEADTETFNRHTEFSSNARHLIRKSEVPVWAVAKARKPHIHKICAAVDLARISPENDRLNRTIIANAVELARNCGAELHIFHAWRLISENLIRTLGGVEQMDLAQWVRDELTVRRQLMMNLLDFFDLSGIDLKLNIAEGVVQSALPEYVKSQEVDLLIMGTLSRGGVGGMIIGNTAETILGRVSCSVMAVKPDTFVSPVLQD